MKISSCVLVIKMKFQGKKSSLIQLCTNFFYFFTFFTFNRELEIFLLDLQENMRKRNPDSLSNLIHATLLPDNVIEERKQQVQLINDLKEELKGMIRLKNSCVNFFLAFLLAFFTFIFDIIFNFLIHFEIFL